MYLTPLSLSFILVTLLIPRIGSLCCKVLLIGLLDFPLSKNGVQNSVLFPELLIHFWINVSPNFWFVRHGDKGLSFNTDFHTLFYQRYLLPSQFETVK